MWAAFYWYITLMKCICSYVAIKYMLIFLDVTQWVCVCISQELLNDVYTNVVIMLVCIVCFSLSLSLFLCRRCRT